MAVWVTNSQKLFLPPTPVTKVLHTDTFVKRTSVFCHAGSDRLLTVGNPLFSIVDPDGVTVKIPKVSSNQYRVFRVTLPDPNQFAFAERPGHDPENERLVWGLRGVDVGRGQPLGIGVTGHPLFTRYTDNENPSKYQQTPQQAKDSRQNVGFDAKQTQVLIVGCAPAMGEHWAQAKTCNGYRRGDCPPLELKNSYIQDGDMLEIGYGAMDFRNLSKNKSDAPLDIIMSISKYPDYLKMSKEASGDSMFFFARREQEYMRHFFSREGKVGEAVPEELYLKAESGPQADNFSSSVYFGTPSGSLTSSDSQIFNRPYWLQRSQGLNNGICWLNQLFVTVGDTTRGTNMTISVPTDAEGGTYDSQKFNVYLRHTEEFELSFIFQLCIVPLTPEVIAQLHSINPLILDKWNIGLQPPTATLLEDKYRFIDSLATRCPDKSPPKPDVDPFGGYTFWSVDLTEKFSQDLDQFPLGRKFLAQSNISQTRKRSRSPSSTSKKTVKRKKK
ncbi:L1 [Canis familiaris papillomavirus 20]|uniref:Major capsid protein L1 n=1 Tax=Canis familiaris papillomavirus 20 TaxID=1843776 RepID=A0A142FK20_9PAPI|nr:L1 [Canis familiaris papillomavirus 20]